MRELTFICKNALHHRGRSLLTVGGITVAVAAVVSLVGLANRGEQSFLELYERRGADLVVQRAGGAVQLSSGIDEALGDRIAALPHVREVIGSLMDMVAIENTDLFAVLVNGWDTHSPLWERVTLVEGRRPKPGEGHVVMLGKTLADNLGKHAGDTVELYAEPFQVVGVFDSFSIYESGGVFMPLAELQRVMDRPGHVTGFVVQVDKTDGPQRVDEVKRAIERMAPNVAVFTTGAFVRNIAQFRVIRVMAWVMSLVALVIGTVGISNTMAMSVFERQSEIGTLEALGWRTSRVVRLILGESLLLSCTGAALGSTVGVLLMLLLARIPATAGIVDGHIELPTIGLGFLLAAGAGLLGAAYPAWWAARLSPVVAMRRK